MGSYNLHETFDSKRSNRRVFSMLLSKSPILRAPTMAMLICSSRRRI